MKKPISATIDEKLIKWIDKKLKKHKIKIKKCSLREFAILLWLFDKNLL